MTVNPKLKDGLSEQLFDAVLSLKTREECIRFFEDVCTINEVGAMAQRLEVARMLNEGCIYDEIVAKTGASTATISRVKRCLHRGADGYNMVFARIEECGGKNDK